MESALRIAAILIGAYILFRVIGIMSGRLTRIAHKSGEGLNRREREKRAQTLAGIIRAASTIVIFLVAALMILRELGYNITPLLTGAGIAGLAFGFGAQNLVRDVITGFFILLENQYSVGDWVQINNVDGVVKNIGLRITVLQDMEGATHIMPNGTIQLVSNFTKEYNQALVDVNVAYKEDVDRVREVMESVGKGLKEDPTFKPGILDDPKVLGIQEFGESGMTMRMVCKTEADQKWAVTRELMRRIKLRFDEEDIEIPYAHRKVIVSRDRGWLPI